MDEVVFFHRCSKTVIFCDLIQRFDVSTMSAWNRWLLKLDDLAGPHGSTPREWRFCFWWSGTLSQAKSTLEQKVLQEWQPCRLIIAHGECASQHADVIVKYNLRWMRPVREKFTCCVPKQEQQQDTKED
jgi:hypothetical protein